MTWPTLPRVCGKKRLVAGDLHHRKVRNTTIPRAVSQLLRWQLTDGRWIYANDKGYRCLAISPPRPPFEAVLIDGNNLQSAARSPQALGQLLGGIAEVCLPAESENPSALTFDQLLYILVSNYRITACISSVLQQAIHNAEINGHAQLSKALQWVLSEERGHDQLLLEDFRRLNVDIAAANELSDYAQAAAIEQLLKSCASKANPVSILGVGYVLERNAMAISAVELSEINRCFAEAALTRCGAGAASDVMLRSSFFEVHSAAGAEAAHMATMHRFLASLENDDLAQVLELVELTAITITDINR